MSILDPDFDRHVAVERSPRAKASEMEHALRYHIRKHLGEDPEHYGKLSERLGAILKELHDRWDELVDALRELVNEARKGRGEEDSAGLDPETQAPFLGVLKQEIHGDEKMASEELRQFAEVVVALVDHIQREIQLVGFWRSQYAQDTLHKWIVRFLDDRDLLPYERLPSVADRLLDLACANRDRLTQ